MRGTFHTFHVVDIFFLFSPETTPTSLCPVFTLIFQDSLFSVMSAVSSYLVISSRLLSVHLRLGRPFLLLPGSTISIIFLQRLYSASGVSIPIKSFLSQECWEFGIFWYPLVWPGFCRVPFWSYPLSIVASSFPLHAICSLISFWPPNTLLHMALSAWSSFYTPCL